MNNCELKAVAIENSHRTRRRMAWWQARKRIRVNVAVIRQIQGQFCCAESLFGSDRRLTGGPEGHKQGLSTGKKADVLPIVAVA
jgi:hypothetical protein